MRTGCSRVNKARAAVWALLTAAVAAAVVLRVWSAPRFADPDGGYFFYSVDSYDHLRRISLAVKNFPLVPSFDSYAAYPKGLGQVWAPLFDYVLGLVCLLAGGGRAVTETVCFFTPPVLAAMAVVAVFFVARASFGAVFPALAAAFILGTNPAFVSYTLPMNFDHHAAEPLIVLLLYSLPLLRRDPGPMPAKLVVFWAAALLAVLFTWRGATIYWGLSFVSAFLGCLATGDRRRARSLAWAHGWAALALAGYCLADPWGNAGGVAFGVISWFHAAFAALWAVFFALYASCSSAKMFFLITGVAAGAGLAAGAAGPLLEQVRGGLSFLRGHGDPWLEVNSELRAVFSSRYPAWFSLTYLGVFWAASFPAAVTALRRWTRRRDPALLNFICWSPLAFMGTVIRYGYAGGVYGALGAAYLCALAVGEARRKAAAAALAAAVVAVGLGVSWPHYRNTLDGRLPRHMRQGLYGRDGVLAWLRERTPETSYYDHPLRRPEYGVLARWSLGARIYQLARRPSLSTAFGWETHGFFEEAGFWSAVDAEAAYGLLRKNNIRYVVAQAVHDLGSDYAVAAKAVRLGKLPKGLLGKGAGYDPARAMQRRLILGDGGGMAAAGGFLPALGHFRLLFETRYPGGGGVPGGFYKVFEVVPGAVIRGRAEPGMPVSVSLTLRTGAGRRLLYFDRTMADGGGEYALTVPYNTSLAQGDTRPRGPYAVRVGGFAPREVVVSEKQVAGGGAVWVGSP